MRYLSSCGENLRENPLDSQPDLLSAIFKNVPFPETHVKKKRESGSRSTTWCIIGRKYALKWEGFASKSNTDRLFLPFSCQMFVQKDCA